MTDLPQGWEWTTLGEIVEMGSGGTPRAGSPEYYDGDIPWAVIGDLNDSVVTCTAARITQLALNESSARMIPPGTLLLAMYGSIGKLGIAGCHMATNQAIAHILPNANLDGNFLFQYLYSQRSELARSGKGATQKNISQTILRRWRVPLPPLVEQRRIVEALDSLLTSLDAGVRTLRSALQRVAEYERRLLSEASHGGLRRPAVGATVADPAPADVQDGELPALPASWKWFRLHEVAEVVGGVTKDAAKQSDPSVPLVPYLRVANVQRGYLDLDEIAEIRVSDEKIKKLELRHGDVLLNEGGDRDKLGRGWVWEGQIERCIHQNHVFRARIRDDVLHPKLLAWHANSFGRWFEVNGKQSVNLASISLNTIRQLPVPVPPQGEQADIVAYIEDQLIQVRRLRMALEAGLARAASMRRSVLAEAFAGRLVPQDPNDEPASVLLERIRAERDAQSKQGRRRRVTAAG